MERFGEKIKVLRIEKGLNIRQLSKELNLKSNSYITELEKGKKTPSTRLLIKISNYFNASIDSLVRDEMETQPLQPPNVCAQTKKANALNQP